jgi:DNA-binding CsgD family transcriptional regulator
LIFRLHHVPGEDTGEAGEWMLILQEESAQAVMDELSAALGLTAREAEVLYWAMQGKINRDIGDILGSSPMTVKKHLERIYAKLGVETRTAAAALAQQRIRQRPTA